MAETLHAVSLIGRQHQLDSVRGWVAELAAGHGRAVLVEGEPGIGKSSLMRVAADEAGRAGCQVFWAACDELSRSFPLLPLIDALEGGPRGVGGCPNGAPDRETRAPGQRSVADLLDSGPGSRMDMVAAAAERLLGLVDEYCSAAPSVLFVDDLQWADRPTVMTLGRLARSVHQLPLLLVCTTRPVPQRDDLGALRRALEPGALLSLSALSGPDTARLIARKAGGRPGRQLLRLAEGAAGNPLYLTELVDALDRGGALVQNEGWVEARDERAPDSLAAAIADRLEFLSAPCREVLRGAALLGAEFSVSDLAVVAGQRVGPPFGALRRPRTAVIRQVADVLPRDWTESGRRVRDRAGDRSRERRERSRVRPVSGGVPVVDELAVGNGITAAPRVCKRSLTSVWHPRNSACPWTFAGPLHPCFSE